MRARSRCRLRCPRSCRLAKGHGYHGCDARLRVAHYHGYRGRRSSADYLPAQPHGYRVKSGAHYEAAVTRNWNQLTSISHVADLQRRRPGLYLEQSESTTVVGPDGCSFPERIRIENSDGCMTHHGAAIRIYNDLVDLTDWDALIDRELRRRDEDRVRCAIVGHWKRGFRGTRASGDSRYEQQRHHDTSSARVWQGHIVECNRYMPSRGAETRL